MLQLKASGYSKEDRYEILNSGMKRFDKLKSKKREGERPFYRSKNFERKERTESKKKKKNNNWFKDSTNKYKTVFFVPPTPNNVLLKMLQRTEEKYKVS